MNGAEFVDRHDLGHAKHAVQRCPDLVAHGRQKLGLRAIRRLSRLSGLTFDDCGSPDLCHVNKRRHADAPGACAACQRSEVNAYVHTTPVFSAHDGVKRRNGAVSVHAFSGGGQLGQKTLFEMGHADTALKTVNPEEAMSGLIGFAQINVFEQLVQIFVAISDFHADAGIRRSCLGQDLEQI